MLSHKSLFFHQTVYRSCHFIPTQTCDSMQRLYVASTKNKLSSTMLQLWKHKTCLFMPYMAPNRFSHRQVFWLISERDRVFVSSSKPTNIKMDKFDSTFYPCVTDIQNWVGDNVSTFFFCLNLRLLMSHTHTHTHTHTYIYIYGAPFLDVSRSHTTTQHSR